MRAAAEGGAGRADAEGAGAARGRRLAALGERRHPGTALREDGGARRRSRIPRRSRSQVRELQQQWRQAADVPRAQGEALWKRFKAAHDEAWPRCEAHFAAQAAGARRQPREERSRCASAPRRSPTRRNWIQTADEIKTLQAEWKTIGPVIARPGEGDLGAVPRRLRSVLHPPPRRPRGAQGGLGREPREEGSALRARPRRWRTRPTGTRPPPRSSGCRRSGRRSGR